MAIDQVSIQENAIITEIQAGLPKSVRILQVKSEHLLPHTYIVESPSALQILLEPWSVGSRLANSARESSIDFLRAAFHISTELRESTFESITEVVPLAGALYYSLAEAFEHNFGESFNRCFIGARRHTTPTGWVTELSYENFEAMPSNPVILIGDTIATGGTIERIVESTLKHSSDARAIIIYSIAGGLTGAVRIRGMAERIGIPTYLFYSNAIFGVEPNGTDMPWLHPGTIVTPEIRKKAEAAYGLDLGRRWCSIWDWGDRAKHPLKHLQEILERCETALEKVDSDQTKQILERIHGKTDAAIKNWLSPLKLR
jgi:hypothetical protein